MSTETVQEVSKQSDETKTRFAKSDSRYWAPRLFRNTYSREGQTKEVADFCIKIAHGGRRETFNLRTPNQATASGKAAKVYKHLVSEGWEATLKVYKPKAAPAEMKPATVGDLIREVEATAGYRSSTFVAYSQALRGVASGVGGISPYPKQHAQEGATKREVWRTAVDSLSLDILTPENIQKWRIGHVAKAGNSPEARRRAESTAVSLIRNARTLFSEKSLRFAGSRLQMPTPLPFSGIKLAKKNATRYLSKIDAPDLIAAARDELAGFTERHEQFKLFALALFCGLRKAEADTLLWRQVDFTSGQIRIEPTEFFTPKSEESIGEIDVDPELMALLRGWKARATGPFVVESSRPADYHTKPQRWYRCEPDFAALYTWLKSKGVSARKPLHELRKELGAILASEHGIFAAQRVLRHAQISTTASYYADKKRRITAGLGGLLSTELDTVSFASAAESSNSRSSIVAAKSHPSR